MTTLTAYQLQQCISKNYCSVTDTDRKARNFSGNFQFLQQAPMHSFRSVLNFAVVIAERHFQLEL